MIFSYNDIGIIHSCFKEKFGIPRQPGLISEATALLELLPPYNREEALREIDAYSHLWIIFAFHGIKQEQWKPTVRPPRLGGNQRVGVFASRSPFRPNPVGLSLVQFEGLSIKNGKIFLKLKGVDLMDGTPVLDIKPYLPYVECVPTARSAFAAEAPPASLNMEFSPEAENNLKDCSTEEYPRLKELIVQMLQLDPRPAYERNDEHKVYGTRIFDLDLKWKVENNTAIVISLQHYLL
jgi:tRNA-Thr(GGU) m(6)t(6)A37 methyltransferase TsaA